MKTKLLLSALFLFAVLVSNGQWSRDSLSEGKIRMAGATLGTKAYFAGGEVAVGSDWVETDKVEIYDMATETWQMDYLTQARSLAVGVTCGDKVFFAGGFHNIPNPTSRVDIFYSGGLWLETELSVPRFAISAVSNDSLALFAGGGNAATNVCYNVVDIYNINTNQWSIEHLSEPRAGMGSAVAGDLAFFAGGDSNGIYSNKVDIYHFSTGTWTTDTLSLARTWIGATAAQNKVIFAGGGVEGGALTGRVDIYNTETGTWDTASLSMARGFFGQQSVTICGKAYFVGGSSFETDYDTVDIYDPASDTWEVMTMPNRLTWHTVVAIDIDTSLLIAGGFTFTNYPYGDPQKNVEIYKDSTCMWTGIISPPAESSLFEVYPNPSSGNIHIEVGNNNHTSVRAIIYNLQGQVVFTQILEPGKLEFNVRLTDSIYLLKVVTDDATHTELITIQN